MDMPKCLHEVLGAQQSILALLGIGAFTLFGSTAIFVLMQWQTSTTLCLVAISVWWRVNH
ncbi:MULTISPECIES: hypothetical protein [Pseudoalteromonas]|uniref:hypothetical protein n=1 Tax=Pseudoalteromonas TaxID=53246 RepID=UPI001113C4CB|nr:MULTISPECIES: hypothetical protein [Pseudoalteromonas]